MNNIMQAQYVKHEVCDLKSSGRVFFMGGFLKSA